MLTTRSASADCHGGLRGVEALGGVQVPKIALKKRGVGFGIGQMLLTLHQCNKKALDPWWNGKGAEEAIGAFTGLFVKARKMPFLCI